MRNNTSTLNPKSFNWRVEDNIAIISFKNSQRKNPLTFEIYDELQKTFRKLSDIDEIKSVIITSNDGNFCSGGDVYDIIGELVKKDAKGLLQFTRMTGDLIKSMIHCGKPIISAVDGICVGAGAAIACASMRCVLTFCSKSSIPGRGPTGKEAT